MHEDIKDSAPWIYLYTFGTQSSRLAFFFSFFFFPMASSQFFFFPAYFSILEVIEPYSKFIIFPGLPLENRGVSVFRLDTAKSIPPEPRQENGLFAVRSGEHGLD